MDWIGAIDGLVDGRHGRIAVRVGTDRRGRWEVAICRVLVRWRRGALMVVQSVVRRGERMVGISTAGIGREVFVGRVMVMMVSLGHAAFGDVLEVRVVVMNVLVMGAVVRRWPREGR